MDHTQALATDKIGSLIKRYYWPAFISVFVNALYNIVDRIFIGQGVGSGALSGLSIIFPIMLIIMAFGMLFGVGTGVQISIALGERNIQKAEKTLGSGFLMMILVSIFIAAVAFAIKTPLLKAFGATPETMEYAQDYLNIILAGTLFQVVGFSLNNVIRAEGNARVAMYSMLISAGINVILDPIFIFGFGLGVKGAAYATIISMFVMCIWVVLHFVQKRSTVALRLRYIRIDRKVIATIVAIGMAPFAMQLASSLVQGILNTQLIRFGGDIAVAANGILMSIMNMVFMTIVAVNMAIQPIIGFNYGARNFTRVKDTLIKGIWIATAISVGAEIAIHLFPGFLVKLFNANDPELYRIGVRSLHLGMAATSMVGFQVIVGNYFQSTGKARMAMLLSLLRQVIFLIPFILILPSFFDLNGVWLSLPVAGAISAFVVFFYFKKEIKNLNEYIASRELLQ